MPTIGKAMFTGLPTGGAATAPLIKASNADQDLGWGSASAATMSQTYRSGQWYSNRIAADVITASVTWTAGVTNYVPVPILAPLTLAAVGVNLSGAGNAANVYNLGLLTVNTTSLQPAALLASAQVSGSASVITGVFTTPVTVSPGWYYIGAGAGASNVSTGLVTSSTGTVLAPFPVFGPSRTAAEINQQTHWVNTADTGAIVANPAVTAVQQTAAFTVFFQVA